MNLIARPSALAALSLLVLSACGGGDQPQGAPPPPEVGVVAVQPAVVPV